MMNVKLLDDTDGLRTFLVVFETGDDPVDGLTRFAREHEVTGAAVEVLTPDFRGDVDAIGRVVDAAPDVFNHNTETVPRLYHRVRRNACYQRTLNLLDQVKRPKRCRRSSDSRRVSAVRWHSPVVQRV